MATNPETLPNLAPPHVAQGTETALLAEIFRPEINLVILERDIERDLKVFCEKQLMPSGLFGHESTVSDAQPLAETLPSAILAMPGVEALVADLRHLHRLWEDLFSPERTGLRLRVLNQAMCPRFHVDQVLVRMIVTYGGTGTEWLPEHAADRSLLGRPLADLRDDPLADPDEIQTAPPYAIALLKGEAWPGNQGHGSIHRSPHIEPPERRALLTLDLL